MQKFKYCPYCKGNFRENSELYHCTNCKKDIYKNFVYVGAGMVIIKNSKVLLSRRAKEPLKGDYDIPGGFLNSGELPEEAIKREFKEETNLDVEIVKILGMYIDTYGKNNEPTLGIHYIGKIKGGKIKPQDDVASLEWIPIKETTKVKSFKNVEEALRDLRKLHRQGKI